MNAYTFELSSSLWLLVLLILVSVSVAIFTYRVTVPPISSKVKALLICLRSLALALLLFVLFEPVMTIISGVEVPPQLAVLLDNSQSTALDDLKGSRKDEYRKAATNANFSSLSKENLNLWKFAGVAKNIEAYSFDSLDFKGPLTDIANVLKKAGENAENNNVRAYLLISDGCFNQGANPVYEAEALGKPVFTIGIGSLELAKDIAVQTILTNEIAYIDNPIPVNVRIFANGYKDIQTNVRILDNGKELASQKLTLLPDNNNYSIVFEYLPKTSGMHKITINADALPDEATLRNNGNSEYIRVLENKRKIALFAGAPSSDVSFITNVLNKEKGVKIKQFIQKKNSEFYGQAPNEKELQESDLFVFIGFPNSNTPYQTLDLIKSHLAKEKPLLFVASRQIDYNKLKVFEDYLPFRTISTNTREFLALPDFAENSSSDPLLKVNGEDIGIDNWNKLPPLFRTETFVKVKPESKVLSGVKVNNVSLKEPLIVTRNFNNSKSIAVIAYGLYRWKLLGYGAEIARNRVETPDLFDNFITNSVRWLSVARKDDLVKVATTKKFYSLGEKVEFIAQVYDESYSPIDKAVISVNVHSKAGAGIENSSSPDNRTLILNSVGNGRYTGILEGLSKGDYFFDARISLGTRMLGSSEAAFSVGETALEFQDLTMNRALLENIASRTGGKFYNVEDAKNFIDDLYKNATFEERSVTSRAEFSFWNLAWLFFIVALLFATEWFIRKRSGLL